MLIFNATAVHSGKAGRRESKSWEQTTNGSLMSGAPEETRPPTIDDLVSLAREFNAHHVKYIVVGGMAMLQHGMPRHTDDLDFLYETSRENQLRMRAVLAMLPDKAILEIGEDEDWATLGTIRVNDIITVDLMPAACGLDYTAALSRIEVKNVRGVDIPFANASLLLDTKRTWREKDQIDAAFLRGKIARDKSSER